MKHFIGWASFIVGAILILIDLSFGVPWFTFIGLVCGFVWVWGMGGFSREVWIADGPDDDVSRLDLLDGVGVKPPVDLTKLTDEQLEALRREQMRAAWEAVEGNRSNDLDAILASLDESRAELDRRLNILRAQAGWVWPKEGNR